MSNTTNEYGSNQLRLDLIAIRHRVESLKKRITIAIYLRGLMTVVFVMLIISIAKSQMRIDLANHDSMETHIQRVVSLEHVLIHAFNKQNEAVQQAHA